MQDNGSFTSITGGPSLEFECGVTPVLAGRGQRFGSGPSSGVDVDGRSGGIPASEADGFMSINMPKVVGL